MYQAKLYSSEKPVVLLPCGIRGEESPIICTSQRIITAMAKINYYEIINLLDFIFFRIFAVLL